MRQRLRPKRTAVVSHYTEPPEGSTTVCTDELGPVVPRTFDPAPGWSPNGHRIKAPLDYGRDPEKTWVYGALRVRDGKVLTRCAASRNSKGYIASLADIEADNPTGDIFIITDNLSSHSSLETRTWLEEHPRIHHVFIPTGACWLNLQGGGGGSSAVMRWLVRVLPTPRRSSQPRASQLLNSTCGPSPGSGDVLLRITATIADSFVIAFNERSTRLYCDHFAKCCRIFQQVGFPQEWIGFLGFVPILMGIIKLRKLFSKHEVYIRIFHVSPEWVWAALTQPEQLSQWFEPMAYVDLRIGGEIRFGREQLSGEIEVVEPPHRFAFHWHAATAEANPSLPVTQTLNMLEEFTLEDLPGGTRLTLVQSGFASFPVEATEYYLKLNQSGWDGALAKLEYYLQDEIQAYKLNT